MEDYDALPPRSVIWICDVPFNNNYKNVLTFTNRPQQNNYFFSKAKIKLEKYTYVRKDNSVVVNAKFEDVNICNYIVFTNRDNIDKENWIYAFIIECEYVSENSTRIYFETDVFQTYQFEIEYRSSFVEREHVSDDYFGRYTLNEELDLGEYIINNHYRDPASQNYRAVLMSSVDLQSTTYQSALGGRYNGIPTGFKYYSFDTDMVALGDKLQELTDKGLADSVLSIFMAPQWLAGTKLVIDESNLATTIDFNIDRITKLDGYTPKNEKLLTYPYCYFLLSNNQGNDAILRQEVWNFNDNSKYNIKIRGCLCSGCSIRAVPFNYNGDDLSNINGISLGKYPQIGYACDSYINWITQNALNIATNSIQAGANAVSGNYIGTANNILSAIHTGIMSDRIPPQIMNNTNSGDITTAMNENCFHVYAMSIKKEYAKMIDQYFDMFGYKVNTVKSPNVKSRKNWNYLKTINCNFTGNIPEKDMEKIKLIFDNGVTLWHNKDTMYDYDNDNVPVA